MWEASFSFHQISDRSVSVIFEIYKKLFEGRGGYDTVGQINPRYGFSSAIEDCYNSSNVNADWGNLDSTLWDHYLQNIKWVDYGGAEREGTSGKESWSFLIRRRNEERNHDESILHPHLELRYGVSSAMIVKVIDCVYVVGPIVERYVEKVLRLLTLDIQYQRVSSNRIHRAILGLCYTEVLKIMG